MKRSVLREKVLQILFQMDLADIEIENAIDSVTEDENFSEEDLSFIKNRVNGSYHHLKEIDEEISQFLKGWQLDRLAKVDRAILRMSTFELMNIEDVPVKVTLNEAVELAKRFGSDQSPKFINGVLGSMVKANPQWDSKGQTVTE
ncbi:transcription antitermination factor NusB [Tepidibacillus infernus]|uniref:Transcription antitermination protein NusB n=1 Tax=Tepidibacillus decaturensis TaxID=1413211 RepID=A0A135L2T1_9BACI|nr:MULTISPECIES: transcription antitermination factor NusB [Tepidibacillus]KXG43291.1 hypothetical protein U473_04130 [Tepidibacillus decaturensis]GBF11038.1 hypothetical protein HK1_01056 [Tepidibacillus sp. HK-1]